MKTCLLVLACSAACLLPARSAELRAGVGRVEITDRSAGPVHDPLFAKALVLNDGSAAVALVTIDAVAIGELGRVGNHFLATLREQLERELGIPPAHVIVTASHCHGVVRTDLLPLVVQAVKDAWKGAVPVKAGAGAGREDRISENRRLRMKDGSEVDMRRAYSLPPDDQVAGVGPIDPQIGILRLDRATGGTLAVLYQFACHPIMNPPVKGNSADYPGVASKVIEENLGGGAMAVFVQGCCGDINPLRYKEVSVPPDAEPLGNMLGLRVLDAARRIEPRAGGRLSVVREVLSLPRASDFERRMAAVKSRQATLLASLRPTNINFKTFLPLLVGEKLWPEHPSHSAQAYFHDRAQGRDEITKLDSANRAAVTAYLHNISIMEELTRLNTNLALLRMHRKQTEAVGRSPLEAEVTALRVGDFKLITFPGELTVEVGLNIKKGAGDPHAFVSGYTNGYIYYTPTANQRNNSGFAQEDCDCLVAPEWQGIFEKKAVELLKRISLD